MIDNTRRNVMKFMALLGLTTVVGVAAPVRLTVKQGEFAFLTNTLNHNSSIKS